MAAMRKWLVGGWGKGGSRKPRPPGWDDHLGARKPLFGEAALSAFSTRMASSTKSRSWLLHSWMHFQSISHRLGMVSSSQSNNKEPSLAVEGPRASVVLFPYRQFVRLAQMDD